MRFQHVNFRGRENKVTEAAVHWLFQTQVVERINEMCPVEMRVDTEHLTEDCLADIDELNWETTALSNPVTGTSKLRERCSQGCGAGWDRGIRARSVKTTRCVGRACNLGVTSVVCERDSGWIRREDVGVIDLARDPALHERYVFVRGDLNRLFVRVQPCEGVITTIVRNGSKSA